MAYKNYQLQRAGRRWPEASPRLVDGDDGARGRDRVRRGSSVSWHSVWWRRRGGGTAAVERRRQWRPGCRVRGEEEREMRAESEGVDGERPGNSPTRPRRPSGDCHATYHAAAMHDAGRPRPPQSRVFP